ncbi:unnamed protein product [Sympodiomycopsis kandeliae]
MAPGPSSSPIPTMSSGSGGSSSSSSAHPMVSNRSQSQSDAAAPTLNAQTQNSPAEESGANLDLKHCTHCGQQLESSQVTESGPSDRSQRIVSVGSHAFVVRSEAVSHETQPVHSASHYTTDEEGRPLCQRCGEAARSASTTSPGHLHSLGHFEHRAIDIGSSTSTSIGPSTPLSISIGTSSTSLDRTPVDTHHRHPSYDSAQSPSQSTSTHRDQTTSNATEVRSGRADSFSRSQVTHNVGDVSESTSGQNVAMRGQAAGSMTPIVSVPTSSSSSALPESGPYVASMEVDTRNGPSDSVEQGAPTSSVGSITASNNNRNAPSTANDGAQHGGVGPSAMTRPRLSQGHFASQHMQPFFASQILPNPLAAPFNEKTDVPALPQVAWYNPRLPDPFQDVSRLRVPPRGRGCLYPGAMFSGTQRSGNSSYGVTVEILTVDLPNSHLDGYLNIIGLTEDYPELTTFFTAEIIGKDHDFITGRWGAQEADDVKHWNRFKPFKSLQRTARQQGPRMRFNHLNKPYVFMRWKERFLVPDWKVRDISGASFAGFYYVCAEFGDTSEWMNGSVDPENSRFGLHTRRQASNPASTLRTQVSRPSSSSLRTTAEGRTRSPLVPSDVSHFAYADMSSPRRSVHTRRRLGSQDSTVDGDPSSSPQGRNAALNLLQSTRGVQGERRRHLRQLSQPDAPQEDHSTFDPNGAHLDSDAMETSSPPESARNSFDTLMQELQAPGSIVARQVQEVMEDGEARPLPTATAEEDDNKEEDIEEEQEEEGSGAGRITAFYYHANSEPYQRLDLLHRPKTCGVGSFEMR